MANLINIALVVMISLFGACNGSKKESGRGTVGDPAPAASPSDTKGAKSTKDRATDDETDAGTPAKKPKTAKPTQKPGDADSAEADATAAAAAKDAFFNPPELKVCNDKGELYDRRTGECSKDIKYTPDWCTAAGIKKRYGTSGDKAAAALAEYLQAGWKLDQCGEIGDKPIVFLVLPGDGNGPGVVQVKTISM